LRHFKAEDFSALANKYSTSKNSHQGLFFNIKLSLWNKMSKRISGNGSNSVGRKEGNIGMYCNFLSKRLCGHSVATIYPKMFSWVYEVI
jgi:hypothetical protein